MNGFEMALAVVGILLAMGLLATVLVVGFTAMTTRMRGQEQKSPELPKLPETAEAEIFKISEENQRLKEENQILRMYFEDAAVKATN